MIEIKRDSWHFRMYYWWYEKDYNLNLCKYFWRYMGMLVILLVLLVPAAIIATPFVYIWKGGKWLETRFPSLNIVIYSKNKYTPPVWLEYLRAKKDKVCPQIKLVKKDSK